MPQYIKISTKEPVEAMQWTGRNTTDIIAFLGMDGKMDAKHGQILVTTPGGVVHASPQNYFLKDGIGRSYAMPPEQFLKTHTAAEAITPGRVDPDLENATIDQLRQFADANDIDLGEAKKKSDIIAIIEEAMIFLPNRA